MNVYQEIFEVIKERKKQYESGTAQENSYTCYLFDKGVDKICKKIGEEATETVTKHTWQAMHGDSHSCKIYKPLPKQELINRLSGKHPRTPLTQISSVATHRSDAKLSTIIHDRALFLCASLVPQDHAILRNLPCVR